MIVVAARRTDDGFSYTIAEAGANSTSTDYSWEAAEILLELGVKDPVPVLLDAQRSGVAILRQPLARAQAPPIPRGRAFAA